MEANRLTNQELLEKIARNIRKPKEVPESRITPRYKGTYLPRINEYQAASTSEAEKYLDEKLKTFKNDQQKVESEVEDDEMTNPQYYEYDYSWNYNNFYQLKKASTLLGNDPFFHPIVRPTSKQVKEKIDLPLKTYYKSRTSRYITDEGFYIVFANDEFSYKELSNGFKDETLPQLTKLVKVTQHLMKRRTLSHGASAFYIQTADDESPHDFVSKDAKEIRDLTNKSIDAGFDFISRFYDKLGTVSQCYYCHDTSLTKSRDYNLNKFKENTLIVKETDYTSSLSKLRKLVNEAQVSQDDDSEDSDHYVYPRKSTIVTNMTLRSVMLPGGKTITILRNNQRSHNSILNSLYPRINNKKIRKLFNHKASKKATLYLGDLFYDDQIMKQYQRPIFHHHDYEKLCGFDKLDDRVYGAPKDISTNILSKYKIFQRSSQDENYIKDSSFTFQEYASENIKKHDINLYQGDDLMFNVVSDSPYVRAFSTRPLDELAINEMMWKFEKGLVTQEGEVEEYINQNSNNYGAKIKKYQHMIVTKDFQNLEDRHLDLRIADLMTKNHTCHNCGNHTNLSSSQEIEDFGTLEYYRDFLISAKNLEIDAFCFNTFENKELKSRSINDVDDQLMSQIMGTQRTTPVSNDKEFLEFNDEYSLWRKQNLKVYLVEFEHRLDGKTEDDYCLIISDPSVSKELLYKVLIENLQNPNKSIEVDLYTYSSGMHRLYSALKRRNEFSKFDDEIYPNPNPLIDNKDEYLKNLKYSFASWWGRQNEQYLSSSQYDKYMRLYDDKPGDVYVKSSSLNFDVPLIAGYDDKGRKRYKLDKVGTRNQMIAKHDEYELQRVELKRKKVQMENEMKEKRIKEEKKNIELKKRYQCEIKEVRVINRRRLM
ncbi:hypothetical protein BN7_4072 [Wickerhamomyces ciferrii]|uniref:Uncharacterized protein n=1 Tax=Wickerhamomyces ciferrii (strain ATCC 14091 / BCRC 22168 / CBS 111 / JCM 3599 / NBRC 0793 / NRRL Y-1031 F-60-10) TaxID=1206466 RepID=K0KT74_WICCF|nr:uncharacterized protein BN7_4072 [Wickerhamomyces ciferrii]CCH44508.1 hypothetical protein BN7_4072 [Wickerhamomyces ciferrii]